MTTCDSLINWFFSSNFFSKSPQWTQIQQFEYKLLKWWTHSENIHCRHKRLGLTKLFSIALVDAIVRLFVCSFVALSILLLQFHVPWHTLTVTGATETNIANAHHKERFRQVRWLWWNNTICLKINLSVNTIKQRIRFGFTRISKIKKKIRTQHFVKKKEHGKVQTSFTCLYDPCNICSFE